MKLTVKAILARFNGDVQMAVDYCAVIASTASNPHLREEYRTLAGMISDRSRK